LDVQIKLFSSNTAEQKELTDRIETLEKNSELQRKKYRILKESIEEIRSTIGNQDVEKPAPQEEKDMVEQNRSVNDSKDAEHSMSPEEALKKKLIYELAALRKKSLYDHLCVGLIMITIGILIGVIVTTLLKNKRWA